MFDISINGEYPYWHRADVERCGLDGLLLKDVLRNWSGLGSNYRFSEMPFAIFLNTSIYGTWAGTEPECELRDRYRYWASKSTVPEYEGGYEYSRRGNIQRRLPDPHNMGQTWYQAACNAMREDLANWDNCYEWECYWRYKCNLYYKHKDWFAEGMADSIADAFEDWREMMNF